MTASQGAQGTIDSDDFHYTEWSVVQYLPQPDETSETLHSEEVDVLGPGGIQGKLSTRLPFSLME